MDQVGQTKLINITPTPTNPNLYAYVWAFWDGTSETTSTSSVTKRINIGGRPGTGLLNYSVTAVLADGQAGVLNGTLDVNNPPSIISPIEVTHNDSVFPYDTTIRVRAFDFDSDALSFFWYEGATPVGGGTTTPDGTTSGTWRGNGTTVVGTYPVAKNEFSLTVHTGRTLTLKVVDARSGTSSMDVELRGRQAPPAVLGGAGAGQTTEGLSIPTVRVGEGAEITFSVYANDPGGQTVSFEWLFDPSDGWTMDPATEAGTSEETADAGFVNTVVRDVSQEVVEGSRKTVRARARVTIDTKTTELIFEAVLLANRAPVGLTFSARAGTQHYDLATLQPVTPGTKIELVATAEDPDFDVVEYRWQFTQPFTPTALTLWGAKVLLDTSGYVTGQTLFGVVTAYDRFGAASSPVTVPLIPFTSS